MKPRFADKNNNDVLDAIIDEQLEVVTHLLNLRCTELATHKQIDLDRVTNVTVTLKSKDGKTIRTIRTLDEITEYYASFFIDKFVNELNEDPTSFKPFTVFVDIVDSISCLDIEFVPLQRSSFEA